MSLACHPSRTPRESKKLGRSTCLTKREESHAIRSCGVNSSDIELSDGICINIRDVLRPVMPKSWMKNPRQWLSNLDIDAVVRQYLTHFKFDYMGSVSTDFTELIRGRCVSRNYCTPERFRSLWVQKLLGIGIVNLDVSTGPGTHWVVLAIDFRGRHPRMMFYDPTGKPPPKRWMASGNVWSMISAAIPRSRRAGVLVSSVYNTTVHQRKNTECGMFALMVVDALLRGVSFEQHCTEAINDESAFRNREQFFYHTGNGEKSKFTWKSLMAWDPPP